MNRFLIMLVGFLFVVLLFGFTVLKAGENRTVEVSVNESAENYNFSDADKNQESDRQPENLQKPDSKAIQCFTKPASQSNEGLTPSDFGVEDDPSYTIVKVFSY